MKALLSLSLLGLAGSAWGAGVEAWKSRSIYQLMTDRFALADSSTTAPCDLAAGLYCGGTWRGIINNLDYIEGMGFDAIMVSPIVQNLEGRVSYGEAYHGYWPQDINALNPRFGTEQDFQDLISTLHNRSMFLMVDSVINNMAYFTNGSNPASSVNYNILTPFNQESEYHPWCFISDYEDYPLAQRCWTGDNITALPDLAQEKPEVASTLVNWIQDTLANYSIDGLRIDAAKHVYPDFLPQFFKASGSMFMTGEVFEQDAGIICDYQKKYLPSVPNYPIYYAMLEAFAHGNVSALQNEIQLMSSLCPDVTALTVFTENHDIQRFASYTDDLSVSNPFVTAGTAG
jgi:alpha-amylase